MTCPNAPHLARHRIAPAKIERRLIVQQDEEVRVAESAAHAPRDGADRMLQPVMLVRSSGISGNAFDFLDGLMPAWMTSRSGRLGRLGV